MQDGEITITQATTLGYGSRSTIMRLLRSGKLKSRMVDGKHVLKEKDLARVRASNDTSWDCYIRLTNAITREAPNIRPFQISNCVRFLNEIGSCHLPEYNNYEHTEWD